MIISHIITHGIAYGVITTLLLLIMMISFSPRIWGYADYSDEIKAKAAPQTQKEKTIAWILFVPLVLAFIVPIVSTYYLKLKLGGKIPFIAAFMNLFTLTIFGTLGDVLVLDCIVVSKITPNFVIIPGTDKEDYKDLSHHYRGHVKALPIIMIFCVVVATITTVF